MRWKLTLMSSQRNLSEQFDVESIIAHELRTPLTSIVGFAQALLADSSLEEETREKIAAILKTEGERLNRTVEELTRASALQLLQIKDSLSEGDLSTVLAAVARFASQRFPSKTFCVSYALAPGTSLPAIQSGDLFLATFYLVSVIARLTYDHFPITLGLESCSLRPLITITCRFNTRADGRNPLAPPIAPKPLQHARPINEETMARTIAERVVEQYGGTVRLESLENGEMIFKLEFPA